MDSDAKKKLEVARRHLEKVQAAWFEPTDWEDLSLYGFYCLEAATVAAAVHRQIEVKKTHVAKQAAAKELAERHGLPDVSALLALLGQARKQVAYGDVEAQEYDAEDVASRIEEFFDAVYQLVHE